MHRRAFLQSAAGLASLAGAADTPAPRPPAATAARPVPVVLDTDIGGDIDDALALAILANSPELRLRAVTTVFRNTRRRAQYARRLLDAMHRGDVPAYAGCTASLSPGSAAYRGYADRIGRQTIAGYGDDRDLLTDFNAPVPALHAADYLLEATRAPDGPRHIFCVGSQTNLALALVKDPGLADRLDAASIMGYNFQTGIDRYNVGWDLTAARHVLASGIPLRVLPIEIGVACQMEEAEYAACLASACPHMQIIAPSMRLWVEHVRRRPGAPIPDYRPRPYDSLTVLSLTHPHLFEWKRGIIRLERGDDPSQTKATLQESATGHHWVVVNVDRKRAMAVHAERLLACSAGSAA